jgi:hypothetical protein
VGFAGDLGAEFTGYLLNFIMQIASSITSAFMQLFGRKPKDPLPPHEQVTAMARKDRIINKIEQAQIKQLQKEQARERTREPERTR